jgi:UDP-N-acetylglucosamine--N-acetylmuramyl-(pentapeptide) pyrophosphoryl-undecaprenol N-acetylglucosamine transferase
MDVREIRIVLTGGVSGGHTFPLIAVSRALKQASKDPVELLYIGTKGPFEDVLIIGEGIPAKYIFTGKWRRYFSMLNFTDLFKLPLGFFQALWHLFSFMPDVVFAKGGSVSVPVGVAAWVLHIPIVIHDSDAVAGRANRFLSKIAMRIAVAYPTAKEFFPAAKTALTGNPVREEILSGDGVRARGQHRFSDSKPLVLVLGGSQGARSLNMALVRILPALLHSAQVLHQTGAGNFDETVRLAGEVGIKAGREGYIPVPFLSSQELADALALAEVVISRAGASSITELAATGKTSILVPLPFAANDEQRMNAYEVARFGGAVVLEEGNLGEHLFLSKVEELLANSELRARMSEKIRLFYNKDAAKAIAEGILSLVK